MMATPNKGFRHAPLPVTPLPPPTLTPPLATGLHLTSLSTRGKISLPHTPLPHSPLVGQLTRPPYTEHRGHLISPPALPTRVTALIYGRPRRAGSVHRASGGGGGLVLWLHGMKATLQKYRRKYDPQLQRERKRKT